MENLTRYFDQLTSNEDFKDYASNLKSLDVRSYSANTVNLSVKEVNKILTNIYNS